MTRPRLDLRTPTLAAMLALAAILMHAPARAAEPDADSVGPAVAREVRQAIAELDAEDFATRDKAAERLARRAEEPELAAFLATEFARVLLSSEGSFEVRSQIEKLAKRLQPAAATLGEPQRQAADIGPLLDQLNGNSSSVRDSARRRLKSMLAKVELIGPLFIEVKRRVAQRGLTAESRRTLEPLLDQAREAWLAAEPARVPLPEIVPEQVARWIGDLTTSDQSEAADRFRHDLAERELLDAIARDDSRPLVLKILTETISEAADAATSTTLQNLADFARPALAAEVWTNRVNLTVQYLLVDVPQFNETRPRPTHFDRIDEQTAHCVSGSSLTEGDYPVRIAIPHPVPGQEAMFYLTNLPTPRRRLLYEYQVARDDAVRLREISQRTVDDLLAKGGPLDATHVLLLAQLDPQIASRFASRYLQAVPNQPLATTTPSELERLPTLHAAICYVMTRVGTREAVPALEALARSDRLGKPTFENPYQIAWIAALSIAQRDPWPEVDAWLAGLLDEKLPLAIHVDPKPVLGATAAALLLDRHGASTQSFGLDLSADASVGQCRFIGYRYASDKDRQEIHRWWEKTQQAAADNPAP